MQNPLRTIETNVRGTEVVLNAAAKNNTRVLFASTSEVYGPTTESPLRETANIMCGSSTRSRWSYAISKALGEFLALAHMRESGLSVTIVRLFNTVGPRQTDRYGMVLPVLVRQALLGKSLTVHGSGMQRRCFAYIDDVIDALMRIIDSTSCAGEIINIGNDTEVTILDLARMVLEQTRSDSSVQLVPYDVAYPPGFEETFARVPCLQKLEGLTGYRPRTPLAVALDAVIHDLRQRPGAAGNPRRLVAGAD
jgi:UDP-glucose 4-epimerase